MRRLLTAAGCALVALSATDLQSQVRFGAQASYGDRANFGIGARLTSNLQSVFRRTPIEFHGSFDYFFSPDIAGAETYWEINPNLVYMIPVSRSATIGPYAGGGLNIAHVSNEFDADTELGLNLLAGVQLGAVARMRPFAEVRVELSGGEQFVLTGGLIF